MIRILAFAAVALLCLGVDAQADVFHMGDGLTSLEMVTVGDAGNAADTRYNSISVGLVAYNYNIGKYEVTTAQYCDFLNHKARSDPYALWNSWMANTTGGCCNIQRNGSSESYSYTVGTGSQSDLTNWGNRPVNNVSYWDACRFANWLGNGQGDGDTETGAYTLGGYNGTDGCTIQRNANWTWAVTSEDEWYKAAHYKGGGLNAGYWNYPNQSDSIITSMANYNMSVGQTTNVGSYAYPSTYGTYDQGGNVWEWNKAIIGGAYRGLRGGSFGNSYNDLQASGGYYGPANEDGEGIGFRVSAVPEPSSIIALLGGLVSLLGMRRRKA